MKHAIPDFSLTLLLLLLYSAGNVMQISANQEHVKLLGISHLQRHKTHVLFSRFTKPNLHLRVGYWIDFTLSFSLSNEYWKTYALTTLKIIDNNLLDITETTLIKTPLFGRSFDINNKTNILNATTEYVSSTKRCTLSTFSMNILNIAEMKSLIKTWKKSNLFD